MTLANAVEIQLRRLKACHHEGERAGIEREIAAAMSGPLYAPSGEPLFILRGSDPLSAGLVQLWAERACIEGVDADLVRLAHEHAMKMRMWPR